MLEHREDPPGTDRQVHRAARIADLRARQQPVGQVTPLRDLKGAENGDVDVAAPHHPEGVSVTEERRTRAQGDLLPTGVDQVRIGLLSRRGRPDTEHPVLAVDENLDLGRHVVRNERGHPHTEVDVPAIAQLEGDAGGDLVAGEVRTVFLH